LMETFQGERWTTINASRIKGKKTEKGSCSTGERTPRVRSQRENEVTIKRAKDEKLKSKRIFLRTLQEKKGGHGNVLKRGTKKLGSKKKTGEEKGLPTALETRWGRSPK